MPFIPRQCRFAQGNQSEKACRRLCCAISWRCRRAACYTDFWGAYAAIIPSEQHKAVGKDSGLTNPVERWNSTLRQRLASLFTNIIEKEPLPFYVEPLPSSSHFTPSHYLLRTPLCHVRYISSGHTAFHLDSLYYSLNPLIKSNSITLACVSTLFRTR